MSGLQKNHSPGGNNIYSKALLQSKVPTSGLLGNKGYAR